MIDQSSSLRAALRQREERQQSWWNRAVRWAERAPLDLLGYEEKPTVNDEVLAKNVCMVLEQQYPGWEWLVGCKNGLVRVHSTRIDTNYGYVLHADKLDPYDELVRQAKRAGGEILERYRMKRGRFDTHHYLDRRQFMTQGRGGLRLKFDTGGLKNGPRIRES